MTSATKRHEKMSAFSSQSTTRNQTSAHSLEGMLLVATALLLGIGLLMIYSASSPLSPDRFLPEYFAKHLSAVFAGALTAFLASKFPMRFWEKAAVWIWGLAVISLTITVFAGTTVNGARRWLTIPVIGFRFQPGEIAKFATLLFVAHVLARQKVAQSAGMRHLITPTLLTLIPAGLLLAQPDLGNTVLLFAMVGLLLFAASTPLRFFVIPIATGVAGIALYSLVNPYALKRWVGFLDPWTKSQAEGFQLVQSFVAFGQGGFFGVGLGNGRQKLFYLPEAHTDFILSIVAEEIGLVGVLIVLASFATLLIAGIRIAQRATTRFDALCAFVLTIFLTLPAIMNVAVVTGMMPTKGLTLPFLSYGRTSLIVCCCALGILLRLARQGSGQATGDVSKRGVFGS